METYYLPKIDNCVWYLDRDQWNGYGVPTEAYHVCKSKHRCRCFERLAKSILKPIKSGAFCLVQCEMDPKDVTKIGDYVNYSCITPPDGVATIDLADIAVYFQDSDLWCEVILLAAYIGYLDDITKVWWRIPESPRKKKCLDGASEIVARMAHDPIIKWILPLCENSTRVMMLQHRIVAKKEIPPDLMNDYLACINFTAAKQAEFIYVASQYNRLEYMSAFLTQNVPNAETREILSEVKCWGVSLEMMQLLAEHNIDCCAIAGMAVLFGACVMNYMSVVDILDARGLFVSPDFKEETILTNIIWADATYQMTRRIVSQIAHNADHDVLARVVQKAATYCGGIMNFTFFTVLRDLDLISGPILARSFLKLCVYNTFYNCTSDGMRDIIIYLLAREPDLALNNYELVFEFAKSLPRFLPDILDQCPDFQINAISCHNHDENLTVLQYALSRYALPDVIRDLKHRGAKITRKAYRAAVRENYAMTPDQKMQTMQHIVIDI